MAGIDIPDITARKNCIVWYCNHQSNFPLGARETTLRSNLRDTGYQPVWRIPVNLDRCYLPEDLKRTEFGQSETHLFDAFR